MSILDQLKKQLNSTTRNEKDELWEQKMLERLLGPMKNSLDEHPEDESYLEEFISDLKEKIRDHNWKQYHHQKIYPKEDSKALVYVTSDKLAAYLCVLSPIGKGKDIAMEVLYQELRHKNVTFELDKKLLQDICSQKRYEELFAISRGIPVTEGRKGEVIECVSKTPLVPLAPANDHTIDFTWDDPIVMIEKGNPICHIHPNEPGKDGIEVSGRVTKAKSLPDLKLPKGNHVSLSENGRSLVADVSGQVYYEEGNFSVKPVHMRDFRDNRPSGELIQQGDLIIQGNIPSGTIIQVRGNLLVTGKAEDARITADGIVRIQQGVYGSGKGMIIAGGDFQTPCMDQIQVQAGGSIYANTVTDSSLSCYGMVYILGEKGCISGGTIRAVKGIEALTIEGPSRLDIGCSPQEIEKKQKLISELEEIEKILNKIRKNLSAYRTILYMSKERQEIMEKLNEQKEAYYLKQKKLLDELRRIKKIENDSKNSYVKCTAMSPGITITSEDKNYTVQKELIDIKIFLYDNEWKIQ